MSDCDNWKHRSSGMRCSTCISFVPKRLGASLDEENKPKVKTVLGRCRKHAPTLNGWPVVFESDWCGDHKIDEEKI